MACLPVRALEHASVSCMCACFRPLSVPRSRSFELKAVGIPDKLSPLACFVDGQFAQFSAGNARFYREHCRSLNAHAHRASCSPVHAVTRHSQTVTCRATEKISPGVLCSYVWKIRLGQAVRRFFSVRRLTELFFFRQIWRK